MELIVTHASLKLTIDEVQQIRKEIQKMAEDIVRSEQYANLDVEHILIDYPALVGLIKLFDKDFESTIKDELPF